MRRRVAALWAVGLLVVLAGCGVQFRTRPKTTDPAPPEPMATVFEAVCRRVWREELLRPAGREFEPGDAETLRVCMARQASGLVTEAQLRDEVRLSDEYQATHAPPPQPPPPPPPPPPISPLSITGRRLTADGHQFVWRFATGFRLLEQLAHGREADAVAFLDWARTTGFNGVRVLAMAHQLFSLTPEEGRAALPRLLDLAAARGLYVEIVALADTCPHFTGTCEADAPTEELEDQVRAVGAIAAAHTNATIQVANEHYHATQSRQLHDAAFVDLLGTLLPDGVTWTASPAGDQVVNGDVVAGDEWAGPPLGEYLTRHLGRGRDTWNMVRHIRELENVSVQTGRPVINDEPIGAAEADHPGRRSANPSVFFALGALGRILSLGSTFHFEAGLQATLPGRIQQQCAEAFIEGTRVAPDAAALAFRNAGWIDSPVKGFRFDPSGALDSAVRVYSGIEGSRGWTVMVGVVGDPGVEWANGWRPVRTIEDRPGVRVVEIAR